MTGTTNDITSKSDSTKQSLIVARPGIRPIEFLKDLRAEAIDSGSPAITIHAIDDCIEALIYAPTDEDFADDIADARRTVANKLIEALANVLATAGTPKAQRKKILAAVVKTAQAVV